MDTSVKCSLNGSTVQFKFAIPFPSPSWICWTCTTCH